MSRRCSRPGCAEPATATLAYDYSAGVVWLDDLTDEHHPHDYDLCGHHATSLSVPIGWSLRDQRRGTQGHLRVVAG
ncbi:MAG: DUF3499 family protein [Acidimicrobiia bacterium]|nr:DUF3499 family protein [Acidimicrobiia bacterium]